MLTEMTKEVDTLQAIVNELAKHYQSNEDVHKFTALFGQRFQTFHAVDQKYGFSNLDKPLETVIEEIKKECLDDERAAITKILETIRSGPALESETKTNPKELLIRTWSFAKNPIIQGTELVMYNLYQNTISQGGCLAGIAGRLIQTYTNYVFQLLQDKLRFEKDLLRISEDAEDQLNLELALAISRSESVSPLLFAFDQTTQTPSGDSNQIQNGSSPKKEK